jgi:hypothetical protein
MNILEPGGFMIMVVKARHIKYVPGHKTDKKDSAWICKLLRAGLLKCNFIPCRDSHEVSPQAGTATGRRNAQGCISHAQGRYNLPRTKGKLYRRQNQIDYYKKRLKELGEDSPEKERA